MADRTHFYYHIGDEHVHGSRPLVMDPVLGFELLVVSESTPPIINTVVRGATTGAVARVTKVGANDGFFARHICEGASPTAFAAGETLTYDTGGTAVCSPFISATHYQGSERSPVSSRLDALLNTTVPDDGVSDTPFWDRQAKRAQRLELTGVTGAFNKGDRCTTSGGGGFTVLKVQIGSPLVLWIIRKTGTIATTQTVTNTIVSGGGTISVIDPDPPVGAWMRLAAHPNWNGFGDDWEFIPWGTATDGGAYTGYGGALTFCRRMFDEWKDDNSAANKGTRFFQWSATADLGVADANVQRGGISAQAVPVTGVSGTFQAGETVSGGGWSGTVANLNAGGTILYVRAVNGATLAPSTTITGTTSGATATASAGCYGWQPGSIAWNALVARLATAHAATGALYSGSARQAEGLWLSVWLTEMGSYATGECTLPSQDIALAEWLKFVHAIREHLGNDELPIAIVYGPLTSHASDLSVAGVPVAYWLRSVLNLLDYSDHIGLIGCDDFQGQTANQLPYPTSITTFRPADYLDMGERAWRALSYARLIVPAGSFRPMILILIAGQSQARQTNPAAAVLAVDRDPDLYPSASFPGVETVDFQTWMFNADESVLSWQPYDIALNGNTFFTPGDGTFSYVTAVLAARMRERFTDGDVVPDIGFIHLPVNGSSANGGFDTAFTWDPAPSNTYQVAASMTVTQLGVAGNPLNPLRGRFTAPAGTFSLFNLYSHCNVTGSALGYLGSGGNNYWQWYWPQPYAIDPDGAWIELLGEHVAETALFYISKGPALLWPRARNAIRVALQKCATDLNRIPKPMLKVWWQGEADYPVADDYEAALKRCLDAIESEFGQKHKGETETPTVVVRLTSRTPVGSDEQIEAIRAAQAAYVAAHGNAVLVDTDRLAMESSGVYPRLTRQDNGVHHTQTAWRTAGFLIDEAAGTLQGIPAHPEGSAAVEFGAIDGGSSTEGSESASFRAVEEEGGEEQVTASFAAPTEAQAQDLSDALFESPDVLAYTDASGQSVTRRSVTEMLALDKAQRYAEGRRSGIRRTRARFE